VEAAVSRVFKGVATLDGAGVRLRRIFGFHDTEALDPFLLLDWFGSTREADYIKGFPWHPHRGICTVTYLLAGTVRHGDSLGNAGTIGPGDLQWMTAGSGIIHEEMPQLSPGGVPMGVPDGVSGFQLWLNLAASEKMGKPQYCGVLASEVSVVEPAAPGDAKVRVLAGSFQGVAGPVRGAPRDPLYIDVELAPGVSIALERPKGSTAFAFTFAGSLACGNAKLEEGDCALFAPGDTVTLAAGPAGGRCIWACAQPLRESVAWGGPIVMNTQAELELAFRELDEGTFVKKGGSRA